MSMTRKEAIEEIEKMAKLGSFTRRQALAVALTALRGPTREQVERMRGEWMFPIFADQKDANDPRCQCSECGSIETPLARHRFCPSCGAPITDEAVDMVMEKLEAMHNDL